jgi:hypothetical protein
MSDELKAQVNESPVSESVAVAPAPGGYEPPRLTKVGNVRELLAGEGGTQPDIDPSALDLQQGT